MLRRPPTVIKLTSEEAKTAFQDAQTHKLQQEQLLQTSSENHHPRPNTFASSSSLETPVPATTTNTTTSSAARDAAVAEAKVTRARERDARIGVSGSER